jgi:hypothetical protein
MVASATVAKAMGQSRHAVICCSLNPTGQA